MGAKVIVTGVEVTGVAVVGVEGASVLGSGAEEEDSWETGL